MRASKLAMCLSLSFSQFAFASAELVDLTKWRQVGAPSAGSWTVSADRHSVHQAINGLPTGFMSNETYDYRTFRGQIEVAATAGDDDWIGFMISIQTTDGEPDGFILFDWRKNDQSGSLRGFSLIHFDGTLQELNAQGWGVRSNGNALTTVLGTDHSKEWTHGRKHDFEIQVHDGRVVTRVDGDTIFDVETEHARPGKTAFFNWSQGNVSYYSIEQLFQPVVEPLTARLSQGEVKRLKGKWTDRNTADTHTCTIEAQPKHGTVKVENQCDLVYTPSPDRDGIDTFSYRVTDSSNTFSTANVSLDVLATGVNVDLPDHIEADETTVMPLSMTSQKTADFPAPTLRLIGAPDWLEITGDRLIATPTSEDIGLSGEFSIQSTSRLGATASHGSFQMVVVPNNDEYSRRNDKISVVSTTPLLKGDDNFFSDIVLPPLVSSENNPVAGVHTGVFSLSADSVGKMIVSGVVILPGESKEVDVVFRESGSVVPVNLQSDALGSLKYSVEFPWLDSNDDMRYVSVTSCSSSSSRNCRQKLEFDRRTAPKDEFQAIVRSAEAGEYSTYSENTIAALISKIGTLKTDDLVAININDHKDEYDAVLRALDVAPAIFEEKHGHLVYRMGQGVINQSIDSSTARWGKSAIYWLD